MSSCYPTLKNLKIVPDTWSWVKPHVSFISVMGMVGDLVINVGDEHLAVVGGLHPDLRDISVIQPMLRVRGPRPGHTQRVVGRHDQGHERISETVTDVNQINAVLKPEHNTSYISHYPSHHLSFILLLCLKILALMHPYTYITDQ